MGKRRKLASKPHGRLPKNQPLVGPVRTHRSRAHGHRTSAAETGGRDFAPPEDWHEPTGERSGANYRVVVQEPGSGYRHAVTPEDVRSRLAGLPDWMLEPLEVVQLSRMTRKKRVFPCYGMQWGATLYLYPIETGRVERVARPPRPAEQVEARMYGARWRVLDKVWCLTWSESAIRDFYLNNVLFHELGHLLDDRNSNYEDRERFAEWFALQYGYRPTRKQRARRTRRRVVHRHGPRR
jgi:hypothetical protein